MSKKAVVLFSGGRYSFLTAIRCIESEYETHLLFLTHGSMVATDNVEATANRLISVYGNERVKYVSKGMFSIFHRLRASWYNTTISTLVLKYPGLSMNQLNCLTCHCAMMASAIRYCCDNEITALFEGMRYSQQFMSQQKEALKAYRMLTAKFGIQLRCPVSDIDDDYIVKMLIADTGLLPKVQEAQCYLGCPMKKELDTVERQSLSAFLEDVLCPIVLEYCK